MQDLLPSSELPPIPTKRYFTIGEVSELCGVKPHVLRYWEQEFTQLKPVKRRGNRRYYQHHEVMLVRRIRELLYEQGFTINGARNKLAHERPAETMGADALAEVPKIVPVLTADAPAVPLAPQASTVAPGAPKSHVDLGDLDVAALKAELHAILAVLRGTAG